MNPTGDKRSKLAYKDAIVLSGHMFVGGPGFVSEDILHRIDLF